MKERTGNNRFPPHSVEAAKESSNKTKTTENWGTTKETGLFLKQYLSRL